MGRQSECENCQRLRGQVRSLKRQAGDLKAENRSLRQRIEALEQELRDSKRQATPFSRKKNKNRGNRSRRKGGGGRKPGQGTFKQREPPPESETQDIYVPLDECPDCGGPLEDKDDHEQWQSDIPPVEPIHLRFLIESGYCPNCEKRFRSRHPDQCSDATGAAGVVIGPNAKAMAAIMKHEHGISYEKIAAFFDQIFGLEVSRSTLCQSNRRAAQKGRPVYKGLQGDLRRSLVAFSDETGWRIGLLAGWLWVVTSPSTTVYTIRQSRGHEVVTDILGPDYEGILHSDCFMAYDSQDLAHWTQQKCLAHLTCQLSELEKSKSRGAVRFPRNVLSLLREALELEKRKSDLSEGELERIRKELENRLEALTSEERTFTDPDNRRFAKRFRRQRGRIFTFLTAEEAEPTNNRAERAIRPAVIARKMGGCNENTYGAETHSILASILTTARQRGVESLSYLRKLIASRQRPPPLPAAA